MDAPSVAENVTVVPRAVTSFETEKPDPLPLASMRAFWRESASCSVTAPPPSTRNTPPVTAVMFFPTNDDPSPDTTTRAQFPASARPITVVP